MTASDALEAFGEMVIAIDHRAGRIAWISPETHPSLPDIAPGAPVDRLEQCLPGCGELAGSAGQKSDEPPHAYLTARDGRVVHVRAARRSDGTTYLKIENALERQKAVQRHLADRERLMLTWRSTSVGEMASTIAHELNQPLGAVGNLLNGLKSRAARGRLTPEDTDVALNRALEHLHYASGIIARMREYVDARQPRRGPLAPADLAQRTLDLLDWEIERENIQTAVRIGPDLPPISGDEIMVQQVIANLARNAIDAMRVRPGDSRRLTIEAVSDGDQVEIRIGDTGTGLDAEQADRLFTPFFTTKPSGMGIGLNICRSIIELHSGSLWFTRNDEGGTTFHIALPVARQAAELAS